MSIRSSCDNIQTRADILEFIRGFGMPVEIGAIEIDFNYYQDESQITFISENGKISAEFVIQQSSRSFADVDISLGHFIYDKMRALFFPPANMLAIQKAGIGWMCSGTAKEDLRFRVTFKNWPLPSEKKHR